MGIELGVSGCVYAWGEVHGYGLGRKWVGLGLGESTSVELGGRLWVRSEWTGLELGGRGWVWTWDGVDGYRLGRGGWVRTWEGADGYMLGRE